MRVDACSQIQQVYNKSKTGAAQKTAAAGFRDAIQISSQGRDFQLAKQAVDAAPDVRTELTASIKNSIQAGTYQVSAGDFAEKLLEKYSGLFA